MADRIRTPPQHEFVPTPGPLNRGVCGWIWPLPPREAEKQPCGRRPDSTCHRYYACRDEHWCKDRADGVKYPSIEARDRHEANVHGNGW